MNKTTKLVNCFSDDYYDSKEYTEQELNCLEAITLIIKKIKIIVTGFNKASFLSDQLIAKQEESDDPLTFYKILIQDVKTRWNSTYLLLDRYILLFKYVCQTINDLFKNSKKKKKYLKYQRSLLNEKELELAIIVKTLLICAAFLNPEHRSFKHSTNEEKCEDK